MADRKSPEWYGFAPLPPEVKRRALRDYWGLTAAMQQGERLTGYLELELTALSPIHVGAGNVSTTEDAGYGNNSLLKALVRVAGKPVIPATSLKGALRSNYETITHSCLGPINTTAQEKFDARDFRKSELPRRIIRELPADIRERGGRISVEIAPEALTGRQACKLNPKNAEASQLCPTCALFGTEGLQGRVWFEDAQVQVVKREDRPFTMNSLYQPRLHRAGELRAVSVNRRTKVQIYRLRGRKVYYGVKWGDVPVTFRRSSPIETLGAGSVLRARLYFRNVTPAELGGVLVALGITPTPEFAFPFRTGGGKSLGLGVLRIKLYNVCLTTEAQTWLDFEATPQTVASAVTDNAVLDWILAFTKDTEWFFQEGLRQLQRNTRHPYVRGSQTDGT